MPRPDALTPLFAPIATLAGVGPKLARTMAKLLRGNESAYCTVRDACFHLPNNLVDRRFSPAIREASDGQICTFKVVVDSVQMPASSKFYRGNRPIKVSCSNDSGSMQVVLFNMPAEMIKKIYPIGRELIISGRVERFDYILQMPHPDVVAPVAEFEKIAALEPVYGLTEGLSQKRIKSIISKALEKSPQAPAPFARALMDAHNPQDNNAILPTSETRMCLARYELMALYLKHSEARANTRAKPGVLLPQSRELAPALLRALPYALTHGQTECFQTLSADLASSKRMVRLLQGDVGSGKTIVALLAMLQAVEAGFQAALMVPTELVAAQHYETICNLLAPLGVRCVLLTGSVQGQLRKTALAEIESARANIIIGTHALFQEHVHFAKLALVVVDEQHRFGVNQRMALLAKGEHPHMLQLSATPIPRSMLLMLHGDMDPLILAEKPANRKPITTAMLGFHKKESLVGRLKSAVSKGEKAYWICPLIEDDGENAAAVERRAKEFSAHFKTALVHGKVPVADRDKIMRQFKNGTVEVLVATTVVEVGVDVPDATIMVIEDADCFGLSQLHQLRGRVGRGEKQSFCVLLASEKASDEALARLKILTETEDGFAIAQADFQTRGGGEVIGHRQSGLPPTFFVDYRVHAPLYGQAAMDADALSAEEKALVRGWFEEIDA